MHLRASNFVGGPEKQILEHLQRIDRQRFRPILCSFDINGRPSDLLKAAEAENIPTLSLRGNPPFHPKLILQLRRFLCDNSVRLLVTHGYKSNIIGYLSSKALGVSQVAYSHGWTGECAKVRFYEFVDMQVMKLIHNVVAVSEGHKRQIVAIGVPSGRVTVVHNAVFVPEQLQRKKIIESFSLPRDAVVIVSAGRLSPEKNFAGLIEAAIPIIRQRNNIYFIVLGEGVLRQELEQQIVGNGLQNRFLLPGFCDDVQSLLTDANIFVSSSHTEGLPVAVLEGAGAGLPVVATAVGGTPEVVRDGYNGLLVPAGDVGALRRAIEHLLDNPDEARNMGRLGASLVGEEFNFETQSRKLEALYFRIAKTC
jgi:glycosyltransferase involved in cell wall biosynthesis